MEEKNVNILNDADDMCCGPDNSETPKMKPNHCQEGCCKAKEIDPHYMDIKQAKCIPILAERIYDCVNIESGGVKYIPLDFTITSVGSYTKGDEICIKKIAVTCDFIGLINSAPTDSSSAGPLPVIVDNLSVAQDFVPADCSPSSTCDGETLYNTYVKSVDINLEKWCHGKGRKSKIAVADVEFYVCNLNIYVSGKIGCEDFEAELTQPYSGALADLGGFGKGLRSLDFLGDMCFPAGSTCVNMELKFNSKIHVECITTNQKYDGIEFEAATLASLAVDLKAFSTVKEELVVYTTPHGFICDDCEDHRD